MIKFDVALIISCIFFTKILLILGDQDCFVHFTYQKIDADYFMHMFHLFIFIYLFVLPICLYYHYLIKHCGSLANEKDQA